MERYHINDSLASFLLNRDINLPYPKYGFDGIIAGDTLNNLLFLKIILDLTNG